jgi:hypothetical protein
MANDTDRTTDDDRPTPTQPWTQIDRESVDRVNDLDGTRADSEVGMNALGGDDAQTGWAASDVPPDAEARFEWLAKLQHGYGESDRQAQKNQADIERMIDVVCGQLGVADTVAEQVTWLLDQLSIQSDLSRQLSYEGAVLAASSLVVDIYRSRQALPADAEAHNDRSASLPESVRRESRFKELRADYGVTLDEITAARERIRNTDAFSQFQRRVRR